MITVSTFLWSDPQRNRSYTFTPDHVAILRNMVQRHLHMPFEFVCVTDRPFKMDGVRCVPLEMSKHVPGTCFVRLMLRHPYIGGVLGRRIMNLDLDCVIVDDITPLAARAEDAVFWRNPNYEDGGRRAFYQTSIQLFDAAARCELWTDFDPDYTPKWVNRRFGGAEQAWVSERLDWNEAYWDGSHGVYGAGRMMRDQGMDKGVTDLPDNARIVFFPGNRNPDQPEVQKLHPWIAEHYL